MTLEWALITPAALFMKSPTGRGPPLGYRRFWSAAEGTPFCDREPAGEVGNEQLSEVLFGSFTRVATIPLRRRSQ